MVDLKTQPHEDLDKALRCRGKNCTAINGHGHSVECQAEHDKAYEKYESIWIETPRSPSLAKFRFSFQSLIVEYKNGCQYKFLDVPTAIFEKMRAAPSCTHFLAQEIKGNYRYYRLNGD